MPKKLPEVKMQTCKMIRLQAEKDTDYATSIVAELDDEQPVLWECIYGATMTIKDRLKELSVPEHDADLISQNMIFLTVAMYKSLKNQMEADELNDDWS